MISGVGIMDFMVKLQQAFNEGWKVAGSAMYSNNIINIQVSK